MGYTESYYSLSHGTDQQSAQKIIKEGFLIRGDATSWCGKGVYFYDIKAKAWWAANRKCSEIRKEIDKKIKPTIILADIEKIPREDIFDLRVKDNLDEFEKFVLGVIEDSYHISIDSIEDDTERIIQMRAMLVSFFAEQKRCKLVIGNFRQRPQPLHEHAIQFADSMDIVFGIETIYCVKDTNILSNIRLGGRKK